jgi:serine/threonine-protein kinase
VSALASPSPILDPDALVGVRLEGKYELTGHLATGGMGAVFQARHVHLRKDVAVKVLRPELCSAPDLVERFRREAEIASALEHDNIVRVTDFGRSEDGLLYLVMELLTGESLFDRVRREGRLAPARAVTLLWQVCAGLEAAHQHGVVHRDLKPENVFLARTPTGREVVKLLDFGIAKFARSTGEAGTQTGIVVGTPEYLSPEQAMGLPVDARADVYTVGLIAFRMLVGHHPFKAEDPRGLLLQQASAPVPPLEEANPELAAFPALCAAVAKACAKDPHDRPASAAELGDLLAAALGSAFIAPPGATPVGPAALAAAVAGATPGRARTPGRWFQATRGLASALRGRAAKRWALAAAALLAVAAVTAGAVVAARGLRGRAAARAATMLAEGRPADALATAEAALAGRPADPALLLVRARALAAMPERPVDMLEAFAAAQQAGALESADYHAIVAMLGRERRLSDLAARVLRDASPPAVPEIAALAQSGPSGQRLRAMAVLRDLGAEDAVDRVAVYSGLLADPDCDVRRAAARRLGELGDKTALPALRTAAAASRTEKRFLFKAPAKIPLCGAAEAGEAVRRIQSVN